MQSVEAIRLGRGERLLLIPMLIPDARGEQRASTMNLSVELTLKDCEIFAGILSNYIRLDKYQQPDISEGLMHEKHRSALALRAALQAPRPTSLPERPPRPIVNPSLGY